MVPSNRVHGQPVDVAIGLRLQWRPAVDRAARTIEDAPDQVDADGRASHFATTPNNRVGQVEPSCSGEDLNDDAVAIHGEHLAAADRSVCADDFDELVEADSCGPVDDEQRPCDARSRSVLDGEKTPTATGLRAHSSAMAVRIVVVKS